MIPEVRFTSKDKFLRSTTHFGSDEQESWLRQNVPTGGGGGGLTLPTRGPKYGFQGTIIARNLRQNGFSPSSGGSMFRRGL